MRRSSLKRTGIIVASSIAVVGSSLSIGVASAEERKGVSTGTYQWKNPETGLCIGLAGGGDEDLSQHGMKLYATGCDNEGTTWTDAPLKRVAEDAWSYTNDATRLCLDTENGSQKNGSAAVQGSCTGSPSQGWAVPADNEEANARNIRQISSDKCLDARDGKLTQGANIVIGDCVPNSDTQEWLPVRVESSVRFTDVTGVASHNTYEKPQGNTPKAEFGFFAQALDAGFRQVEIDTWPGSNWKVNHDVPVDPENNCVTKPGNYEDIYSKPRDGNLADCLANIRLWHEHNPGHDPIVIKIEPKDGFYDLANRRPADLDKIISQNLGSDNVFTPSQLMKHGEVETLDGAAAKNAWPLINEMKGKFVVNVIRGTMDSKISNRSADEWYIDDRLKGKGADAPAMAFPVLTRVHESTEVDPRNGLGVAADRAPHYIFFNGNAGEMQKSGPNSFYRKGYGLSMDDAHLLSQTDKNDPSYDDARKVVQEAARLGATFAQTDWGSVEDCHIVSRRP